MPWAGRNTPAGNQPDPYWETIRISLGQILVFANRINLAEMLPSFVIASSKYCLANPSKDSGEYLVYLPQKGKVTVDLTASKGMLAAEWFDPCTGKSADGGKITGGAKIEFASPFAEDAVLYVVHGKPRAWEPWIGAELCKRCAT
jgi:hypothetical protein